MVSIPSAIARSGSPSSPQQERFAVEEVPVWQVDAFADKPFTGNPAAVCLLHQFPSELWMQQIAAEMNLSETAFVVPADTAGEYCLRWFTPAAEVDLCGHATLAAAHTLLEQKLVPCGQAIHFQTRSGILVCRSAASKITLDFPAVPVLECVREKQAFEVQNALGIDGENVWRNRFDLLVALSSADEVRDLRPDFARLREIDSRGVIVTAAADETGVDFISRFFAPQHNIDEDPVTGSAHCCLAPFWAERLRRTSLVGYQASQRGGRVECQLHDERVHLTGSAVTVLSGRLQVDPV